MDNIDCDVCVIGAGSAGLSAASGLAQLGLDTVLIEAGEMGGDCLNTGCVPSKALLAAGKLAHHRAWTGIEGVPPCPPEIDRAGVRRHVEATIAAIAPHDSQERFEGLGVTVLRSHAAFEGPHSLRAGDRLVTARNFVIAAGSSAAVPDIPGLERARVLTNESIFGLDTTPAHLVVVGGGPIGMELAQAHARLGSRVTVLEANHVLPKDDQELAEVVRGALRADGVEIVEDASIAGVTHRETDHLVELKGPGGARTIEASHLLVATGRRPNTDGLDLDRAGIEFNGKGITTDARLRTSQKHVFAIGDIAGGPQFTHVAGYHAGIVIRNLAFRMPAKVDYRALPWVTYTDPELAHVGLTLDTAREEHGDKARSVTKRLDKLDRAVAERRGEGLAKIVALPNGRILGCSIVAPGAGDLIGMWGLAIQQKLTLRAVTDLILPYPTFSEAGKQAASEWYAPRLFSDRTRRVVGLLRRLPAF